MRCVRQGEIRAYSLLRSPHRYYQTHGECMIWTTNLNVSKKLKEMTINDLFVSEDWEKGYRVGLQDGKLALPKNRAKSISLEPITIDEHNWYYEEKDGITLVHEIYNKEKYIRTDLIKLNNLP